MTGPGTVPDSSKKPPVTRWTWIPVLLFFAGLCAATFVKIHNFDIFHRLVVGNEIIRHGQIDFPNPFNYTSTDEVYANESWLFDVPMALLAGLDKDNLTALIIVKVILFALIFIVLYRALIKNGTPKTAAILLLLLAFVILSFRLYIRNFLFSYLFVAILISVLYSDSRADRPDKRMIWLFPCIMILWNNIHAFCIFGFFIIGAALVSELIRLLFFKQKQRAPHVKIIAIALAATLPAVFVSPHPGYFIERFWVHMAVYPSLIVSLEEMSPPLP